jgi:NAD(P)H-nitrite reductase large subunit
MLFSFGIVCESSKYNLAQNKGNTMKVCNCADIDYDSILESVKLYGNDLEIIQEETEAGTICECCLFEEWSMVDISLPDAIKKALNEI